MKKVLVKKGEAKVERMPIKSDAEDSYITRSLVYHENTGIQQFRLGLIELEPGKAVGEHKHNCDEIMHVLEGKGTFIIDGVEYEVKPGDSVYVAPNVVHGGHKNTGEKIWRYLYITGQVLEPLTSADVYLPSGERIKPVEIK